MVTYHKLTLENIKDIANKAQSKPNGCYTLRGIRYRVRDGRVTHYACGSEILECAGYFHVCIGSYKTDSEALKLLKGI